MELKKRNEFDKNNLKRLRLVKRRKRKSKAAQTSKNATESKESIDVFEFINDTLQYKSTVFMVASIAYLLLMKILIEYVNFKRK
jgi:hypothetical protein